MARQILLVILTLYSVRSISQKHITYRDSTFLFSLSIDSTLTEDSVNFDCVIKSITVKLLKTNKLKQTIVPAENYQNCELPKDQLFIIEDINFDGYNDIRLLQFLPAAPNLPYYYWIYNARTQKFQREKALEEITSPEFDHQKKLIYSFWRDGCCDHGLSTYRFLKGKPELIEEAEVAEKDGNSITTVKRRVNGEMKVVKRKTEKSVE